jgi:hypothetical protein
VTSVARDINSTKKVFFGGNFYNSCADCRSRELKPVSLKPPGNEDFKYVTKNCSIMSVKQQSKTFNDTIFCSPGGVGVLWAHVPTERVRKAII